MADLSNSDNDNDILEMKLLKPSISRQSSNDYIESITIQDDDGSDMNDNDKNYNNSLIESQHLSDEIEQNISESLDDLTTATTTSPIKSMKLLHDDNDFLGHFHKKVRVGNHYQARIPKYFDNICNDNDHDDKLLWKPYDLDPMIVEDFLKRLSTSTKSLIPMGKHLRDNEDALYTLQKNNYNVDETINTMVNNNDNLSSTTNEKNTNFWTEEECKNFELGLVRFGKNFYLIQKRRLNTRTVGELVQFYYLWKKSERYDLFANRLRSGKKKYTLNPGISDLMMKYFKTSKIKQNDDNEDDNMSDVQFYFNEDK